VSSVNGLISAGWDRSISGRTKPVRRSYCQISNFRQSFFGEPESFMNLCSKPYVHLPIDAVDTVVFDREDRFEADRYDRYTSFAEARDAARSSIEIMLDEGDYDGEDHRQELANMLGLLDTFYLRRTGALPRVPAHSREARPCHIAGGLSRTTEVPS